MFDCQPSGSFGTVFPPRDEYEVLAYDPSDVRRGYHRFTLLEGEPGSNQAAAFRWGWQKRKRDCQLHDDGFDELRDMAAMLRRAA